MIIKGNVWFCPKMGDCPKMGRRINRLSLTPHFQILCGLERDHVERVDLVILSLDHFEFVEIWIAST